MNNGSQSGCPTLGDASASFTTISLGAECVAAMLTAGKARHGRAVDGRLHLGFTAN